MTMNRYFPGSAVRMYIEEIKTTASAYVNPTTIWLKYKHPNGTVTTVTTSGSDIVNDTTGSYHYDHIIPASSSGVGSWLYRWESTGAAVVTKENEFLVLPWQWAT